MTTHACWKCDASADVLSVAHGGWVCARHGGLVTSNSTAQTPKTAAVGNPRFAGNVPTSIPTSTSTPTTFTVRKEETLALAENTDVGGSSESATSEIFEALRADAEKFGCEPLAMNLPDDLTPIHRAVITDFAYVGGVYVAHDGLGAVLRDGVPYSQRWRADVLGLSYRTVGRTLRELAARKVLKDCGETKPHRNYPRGTKLYGLGPGVLEAETPPVETVADRELEPEPPDEPAVGDAQLREVAVPREFTASVGGASGHAADARRPTGVQRAIFDPNF